MEIKINTSKWQTKAQAARGFSGKSGRMGCGMSHISKLIKDRRVETLRIPGLDVEWVAKPLLVKEKGHFANSDVNNKS